MALNDCRMRITPSRSEDCVKLVELLWKSSPEVGTNDSGRLQPYFDYHKLECIHALHDGGRHVSCRTHGDIVEIAKDIFSGHPKATIKQRLSARPHGHESAYGDESLNSSIELVARLMAMMNIGALRYGCGGPTQLSWRDGLLKDVINRHFQEITSLGAGVKIERRFNACDLERLAGFRIEWTSNIADHLSIVDDKTQKLLIFHHVTFLKHQRNLFPEGFVEETLQTIKLLFPEFDTATANWFKLRPQDQYIDSQLMRCGYLKAEDRHIEKFRFWRERLALLKEEFDNAVPKTLCQCWHDKRNGVQWYTLWLAVLILCLTIFFGMIQSIEGALQVYKAYHPSTPESG